jgi:hypothetical protein
MVSPQTDFTKFESYFRPSLSEVKSVQTRPSPLKVHLDPVLSVRLQFLWRPSCLQSSTRARALFRNRFLLQSSDRRSHSRPKARSRNDFTRTLLITCLTPLFKYHSFRGSFLGSFGVRFGLDCVWRDLPFMLESRSAPLLEVLCGRILHNLHLKGGVLGALES